MIAGPGGFARIAMNIARLVFLSALILIGSGVPVLADQSDEGIKTVLGPRNPRLADGAEALLDGDAEKGIRLTKLGLAVAQGRRERQAGLSNLCAGYVMLEQYETAIEYCDTALEENDNNWRALCNRALINIHLGDFTAAESDLVRGEALAPYARSLKVVRGMLLDATDPVQPNIIIDDRRDPDANDES